MLRRIITIDKDRCDGCGLCISACHEGALELIDGKATLIKDDYCDGLGDCLPTCPTDAISFVEREAAPYDEAAVLARMAARAEGEKAPGHTSANTSATAADPAPSPCGCPGSQARSLQPNPAQSTEPAAGIAACEAGSRATDSELHQSALMQWPVQIKLVPSNAAYFDGADVLIAADCTAFAYADFHRDFMEGKITLIGCPKLDEGDYSQKFTDIFANNNIASVTVTRMEVPCCGGIQRAVETALQNCGKSLPYEVVTLSTNGQVL